MKHFNQQSQSGQTLIETVVAIFILTMGIVAALGLANFAVSSSSNIVKQIIGMGLAREGVEAVKNMRDTNWLQGSLTSDCTDLTSQTKIASCYKDWLNPSTGYNIKPPSDDLGKEYLLTFSSSTTQANGYWQLSGATNNFTLYFDSSNQNGYYGTTASGSPSGFYRKISLTKDTKAPFNLGDNDLGPRLLVVSEVWWNGKRCPTASQLGPPAGGPCYIKLQTYLTNWKNY